MFKETFILNLLLNHYLVLLQLHAFNGLFSTITWVSQYQKELEGKYSLESTNPRESEIRANLRP